MGQDWSQRVRRVAAAAEELRRGFFADSTPALIAACEVVAASLRRGGRLYLFGNGGSAADAQHIAAEFVNRLDRERPALAALALTTDSSALTSIANDRAYDQVFSRQLEAFAASGDVALGISTSGNSPSVLSALSLARERCLVTLGLLGGDGGKALALCDHPLVVPSRSTQRIQELHIMLGHLLAELVEEMLEQPEGAR